MRDISLFKKDTVVINLLDFDYDVVLFAQDVVLNINSEQKHKCVFCFNITSNSSVKSISYNDDMKYFLERHESFISIRLDGKRIFDTVAKLLNYGELINSAKVKLIYGKSGEFYEYSVDISLEDEYVYLKNNH